MSGIDNGGGGSVDFDDILDKPTYYPSRISDVENLQPTLDGKAGVISRATVAITSSSLANLASQSTTVTMAKSYRVLAIQFDRAARITFAATTAIRDADVGRSVLVDPAAGVYLDVVSTGAQTIILSGGSTFGSNMESTPVTSIPINIYNLSGSTSTVAITITYIAMEG